MNSTSPSDSSMTAKMASDDFSSIPHIFAISTDPFGGQTIY
jgi:hypothetical protein